MNNQIKVSVCVITYNHESYISDTLNGIFSQKVPFDVEVIIAEDCSPDNTKEVVHSLINNIPDNFVVHYFRHKKNLGPIYNLDWALKKCTGEYIAWCEGDDYWTDVDKLVKQVQILDRHPEYSMSTHNALVKYEYLNKDFELFNDFKEHSRIFSFEEVLKSWSIPSASMVVRKNVIERLPDWFKTVYNGDWTLQLLAALYGDIHYLNVEMCVYRRNEKSLSFLVGFDIKHVNNNKIYILEKISNIVDDSRQSLIKRRIADLASENRKLKFSMKYRLKTFIKRIKSKYFIVSV